MPPRGASVDPATQLKVVAPKGLTLVRHRIKPRGVEFVYETPTITAVTGRHGTHQLGFETYLFDGQMVLNAIIHSYKSMEKALASNV